MSLACSTSDLDGVVPNAKNEESLRDVDVNLRHATGQDSNDSYCLLRPAPNNLRPLNATTFTRYLIDYTGSQPRSSASKSAGRLVWMMSTILRSRASLSALLNDTVAILINPVFNQCTDLHFDKAEF
jgi:hypothetical protein